jgi:protoheme IX farnesyltransferase
MKDHALGAADGAAGARGARGLADYVALAKPRLNVLVVASSAAGYYVGLAGPVEPTGMAAAVLGITLVAAGAAALNQLFERDADARMRRTRLRPLPDGRVSPADAAVFGSVLSAAGVVLLIARANALAALLALATLVVYLAIYTPMKRRTPLAMLVGAVPGALPPLIGWTAARGDITAGGAILFVMVFLWQIPHFIAISWMYREDYAKAGFPMLSVVDLGGQRAGRQALIYAALLVPAGAAPTLLGLTGWAYLAVEIALGLTFLAIAARFAERRDDASARLLFHGSITYLPLLWLAMLLDKR